MRVADGVSGEPISILFPFAALRPPSGRAYTDSSGNFSIARSEFSAGETNWEKLRTDDDSTGYSRSIEVTWDDTMTPTTQNQLEAAAVSRVGNNYKINWTYHLNNDRQTKVYFTADGSSQSVPLTIVPLPAGTNSLNIISQASIDVCGEFVPPDTLVLTTEGRPEVADVTTYYTSADDGNARRTYPVAILVNHASASGAEVVAGALQDLKRAIIVGSTTFGKGSVQSVMQVGSDTAIRLTTAKYYTPSKRTIHENGVIPNIIVTLTPAEEKQLMRQWREESEDDPAKADPSAKPFRDRQLARAVDALKGALVYSELGRKKGKGRKK